VVAGDDVVLVVEDQHRVGLVGERRGAAQVVDAHPLARLQALLVGRDDGEHRDVRVEREVLEALHDERDALVLVLRAAGDLDLLEVVDEDGRQLSGLVADLLDGVADDVEGGAAPGGAVEHESVGVGLHDLEGLPAAGPVL
jgi:hypothetical protein